MVTHGILTITAFAFVLAIKAASPPKWDDIRTYYALGDSYAAGIGAGRSTKHLDSDKGKCYRFDQAYPNIVAHSAYLLHDMEYQHLACTGAIAKDVIEHQLPVIPDHTADLITLTVGGNDAKFVEFLNDCIYQWGGLAGLSPPRSCLGGSIRRKTLTLAAEPAIRSIVESTIKKLSSNGILLYTGYPTFFGDSPECDDVSLSFYGPGTVGKTKLTKEIRNEANTGVLLLNHIIQSVCDEYAQCHYVSVDEAFTNMRGRFCEIETGPPDMHSAGQLFFWHHGQEDVQPLEARGLGVLVENKKVFHPRRRGHLVYMSEIIAALEELRNVTRQRWD